MKRGAFKSGLPKCGICKAWDGGLLRMATIREPLRPTFCSALKFRSAALSTSTIWNMGPLRRATNKHRPCSAACFVVPLEQVKRSHGTGFRTAVDVGAGRGSAGEVSEKC